MKQNILILFSIFLCILGYGEKIPEKDVIELVNQLVSPVPPPHEDQYLPRFDFAETSSNLVFVTGYKHEQVSEAEDKLKSMGTEIYPILVKYIDDERYSYSYVSAAWINYPVASSILDILEQDIEFYASGYKVRDNPTGSNSKPWFRDFIMENDPIKWAEKASVRDKLSLKAEYIEWYIKKETNFGFVDINQEKLILDPYRIELRRIQEQLKYLHNQQVDPTVKTPVESGNEQGTAGHP